MDDITVNVIHQNHIKNTQSQDNTSVMWLHDCVPHQNIDRNKSLVEEKQRLELFDWFQKGQFFILDGYVVSLSSSESILYLPIFLYS